jgi:hypothetical protein
VSPKPPHAARTVRASAELAAVFGPFKHHTGRGALERQRRSATRSTWRNLGGIRPKRLSGRRSCQRLDNASVWQDSRPDRSMARLPPSSPTGTRSRRPRAAPVPEPSAAAGVERACPQRVVFRHCLGLLGRYRLAQHRGYRSAMHDRHRWPDACRQRLVVADEQGQGNVPLIDVDDSVGGHQR